MHKREWERMRVKIYSAACDRQLMQLKLTVAHSQVLAMNDVTMNGNMKMDMNLPWI